MELIFIIAAIIPVIVIGIMVFTFVFIFSPKGRSKIIGRQLEAQKQILDDHGDTIKDINMKSALMTEDGVTITSRAVSKGLKDGFQESTDKIYCKHCGKPIDADSKFCKGCGKEQ